MLVFGLVLSLIRMASILLFSFSVFTRAVASNKHIEKNTEAGGGGGLGVNYTASWLLIYHSSELLVESGGIVPSTAKPPLRVFK